MSQAPIAIVGRACLLPGAASPEQLWEAVRQGRDLLSEAPAGRWRLSRARALAQGSTADRVLQDRALHDRGGYVTSYPEVKEAAGLDPQVAWLFHTAQAALADVRSQGHGRRGAIFGNLSFPTGKMAEFYEAPFLGLAPPDPRNRFMSGLPALLLEEHLHLEAGALALDAACASSLYAIKLAVDALAEGRADLMLAGAVNCADDLFIHVGFTALSALSKRGQSRPFDRAADGLVPAEGAAFLALKRLEDARRDGDRIWAVIRGVGLSNDGRGRGFLAPSDNGQARAMRAAFAGSGLTPQDITLLECHATGTPVGDATELASTSQVYAGHPGLPIGSLKSNLGHLITAAGVAGIIKVIQAMEAGVRPPTLHVEDPVAALDGTPLRLLRQAEPWEGPRRAAVSAFGFGGNNAHLLLEAHDPATPSRPVQKRSAPIAIVGIGVRAGAHPDRTAFEAALFGNGPAQPQAESVALPQHGLRFPPSDLKQTLPQQLLMLAAAEEAVADRGAALPAQTQVMVGMGADVEVCRYGLRWRLAEAPLAQSAGPAWTKAAQDAVIPVLQSAGVVGTMPNVVANRLSSHFGLEGPGFTVSAEERSGLEALQIAALALARGEVQAALVGAVDLGASPVHQAAAAALLPAEHRIGGDAAVALVLERLEDAQAAGRKIYAILDDAALPSETALAVATPRGALDPSNAGDRRTPPAPAASTAPVLDRGSFGSGLGAAAAPPAPRTEPDLTARFGHTHAASGLLRVAASALGLARRRGLDGAPRLEAALSDTVRVQPMAGRAQQVRMRAGPTALGPEPRAALFTYAAPTVAELQGNLQNDRVGGEGPCRAAVVARSPAERREKAGQAALRLGQGASWPGVRFATQSQTGELAFVFAAAGAAYPGMGKGLVAEWPDLLGALADRFASLPESLAWSFADPPRAPNPMERLFGTAALAQLHYGFAHGILGLRPQASLGYSSGESAGLFALGVWRDLDAMYEAALESRLFETKPHWATWAVRASPAAVQAALQGEPRAHLGIIHSDHDCVVSGDAEACARVIARLGADRARRIDYDLWVHVPEAEADRDRWLKIHDRETFPIPGLRVYGHAVGGSYPVSREACREAVTAQAIRPLDLRPTIQKAYQDGVRIFVELGPRGAVSAWIREILGDAPALVVSLDDEGGGRARMLDAVAQLWVHGVQVNLQALATLPAEAAATMSFPAHRPPIVLPAVASSAPPLKQRSPDGTTPQFMAPAPALPPILAPHEGLPVRAAAATSSSLPGASLGRGASQSWSGAAPSLRPEAPVARASDAFPVGDVRSVGAGVLGSSDQSAPHPLGAYPSSVDRASVSPQSARASSAPALASSVAAPAAHSPAVGGSRAPQPLSSVGLSAGPVSASPSKEIRTMPRDSSPRTLLAAAHQAFLETQAQAHQHFLAERQRMVGMLHGLGGSMPVPGDRLGPPVQALHLGAGQTPDAHRPTAEARPIPSAPGPSLRAPNPPAPAPVAPGPAAPSPIPAASPLRALASEPVVARPVPAGLAFDRRALEIHAGGKISEIFGPKFAAQDGYRRQVRMPEPPLLLADRVTSLVAEPASMGKGTIVTQTDVKWGELYLHEGRMSPGLMIESGQADLMLISYLGIDLLNKGERVYRLLGCELTYHGDAPKPGETLEYQIHVDGHAQQGDIRLFFFHYDCTVNGELRLSVRQGQAGFFTDQELADSAGVLWSPETQAVVDSPRLDPPAIPGAPAQYDESAVQAFAEGRGADCFGPGFEYLRTHVRTPRIPTGALQLFDRVTNYDPKGGPWGRGYLSAELDLSADDWFFKGHFKGDPCMPGTLMFDGCIQAMSFYLAAQGFTVRRDGHRFQPVNGEAVPLRCRGQVTPTSQSLRYEIFVEELEAGPEPTLWADVLCTVDGLKAFHARRMGIRLVPDWPLTSRPQLLGGHLDQGPVAKIGDFTFGYASLLACAWGKPSEAFGEMYRVFDGTRRVARLPGPPYHFMSRVADIEGPIGVMRSGAKVEIAYDIPREEWYFDANGARVMPFAVLLEAALQPCGWLASYVGSALTVDEDLSFRNLDGTGTLHVDLLPESGTFTTKVELKGVSKNGGTIIESFAVECFVGETKIYTLNTVFGFFPLAALENQVGLPTTPEQRAELTDGSDFLVDLTARPARYCDGGARLADERLLMIDRVTGFWTEGGAAGKGRLRAEKDVDAAEWFFKAHFFQDPVQPGSLGIEAMIQLLQFYMLHAGLDEGIPSPRFESLETGRPLSWKYRGQVVPKNKVISTTLDLVEVGRDERGPYAVATASLWVDGKRIYEAKNLGMRIVSDPEGAARKRAAGSSSSVGASKSAAGVTSAAALASSGLASSGALARRWAIDPAQESWPHDHRPTFTVPALPMTGVLNGLVAEPAPAFLLEDVRLSRWITLEGPTTLLTTEDGDRRVLSVDGEKVASGRLSLDPGPRPAPLPILAGAEQPSPYQTGALFHGPAFQRMRHLLTTAEGASAILDASGPLPGAIHWVLLDAATHPIDHEGEALVYYPAHVKRLAQYEPLPTAGEVRCEVRSTAPNGPIRSHRIQLIAADRVLAELELIEAGFPKGRLGQHEPLARRAFLEGKDGTGVALSRPVEGRTVLNEAEVKAHDWLPGTIRSVYGTEDAGQIATKEHWARMTGLHPRRLPEALPLSRLETRLTPGPELVVESGRPLSLNLDPVKAYWREWFGRGPWPIEDLYYGLIERFVDKVVLTDPVAFEKIRGRSVLYLANHQVAVESLLFSVLASAVQGRVTVTLAKIEHQTSWIGELIRRSFNYPDIRDPGVIEFFDRADQGSLPEVIAGLRARLDERSLMVHIEGTRALSGRAPVQKMSGAFIDLALATNTPIVPVRFTGGLPVAPLETRLELPVGMGRQSIWFGAPLFPEDLAPRPYGERKAQVIAAINGLGPAAAQEQASAPNPALVARIDAVRQQLGVDAERAALASVLLDGPRTSPESDRLAAALRGEVVAPDTREGAWIAGFAAWLRGA